MTTKHIITTLLVISVLMGCKDMTPKQYADKLFKPDYKKMAIKKTQFKLKPGDIFYFGYSNQMIDRFTVIDTNSSGVYTFSYSTRIFFPYHDLQTDNFKLIK